MRAGVFVGSLLALLLLVGPAAAQEVQEKAISDSPEVIQNLVGLGVWAFIGIGLIFAVVLGVAYVIGNVMMYKSQEMASKQLAGTTRYGVEALINIALLRNIDESLDSDAFSRLERLRAWLRRTKEENQNS